MSVIIRGTWVFTCNLCPVMEEITFRVPSGGAFPVVQMPTGWVGLHLHDQVREWVVVYGENDPELVVLEHFCPSHSHLEVERRAAALNVEPKK